MDSNLDKSYPVSSCWLVGASQGGEDLTDKFVSEGVWQNGWEDKYLDVVRSVQVGDRIAIKSTFTMKKDLPFDNREYFVSVMRIKALGTVVGNPGDGRNLQVNWVRCEGDRDWYFQAMWKTISRITGSDWKEEELLRFIFEDKKQDIDRFRNAPSNRERFGDVEGEPPDRFSWTKYYESIATVLLEHAANRQDLVRVLHEIEKTEACVAQLDEVSPDGSLQPVTDICPFTVMMLFNRQITEPKRTSIATAIGKALGVQEKPPVRFDGIPLVSNQNAWFFRRSVVERGPTDIDDLWAVFTAALKYADTPDADTQEVFQKAYDRVSKIPNVGWKLPIGLYWIRPWAFLPLDQLSRNYIVRELGLQIPSDGWGGRTSGAEYVSLGSRLKTRFEEEDYPVHNFPELSLMALKKAPASELAFRGKWKAEVISRIEKLCLEKGSAEFSRQEFLLHYLSEFIGIFPQSKSHEASIDVSIQELRDAGRLIFLGAGYYQWLGIGVDTCESEEGNNEEQLAVSDVSVHDSAEKYELSDVIRDGAFVNPAVLVEMIDSLRERKNLILQGSPGTGKTWLAKRLGYVLMGERADARVRSVQFHANSSYEDFVRGWRPTDGGGLGLTDGPFLQMCDRAREDPDRDYVVVIEEINRGNPAQIFGEMLTLLEADKRTPKAALELTYQIGESKTVHIPANLYVIGTMNIADRSLAIVDFALRRRFAFVTLEPRFDDVWLRWVVDRCGLSEDVALEVRKRILAINEIIAGDYNLGPQFKIGHSYFTPKVKEGQPLPDWKTWFRRVVRTEIVPLLEEYWFDNAEVLKAESKKLLEGF